MGRPPAGPMSDAHRRATTVELTRLCLGGKPERPELIPTRAEIASYFLQLRRRRK